MAIVSFEKITTIERADAEQSHGAMTSLSSPVEDRHRIYDETWGYFTFGQQVGWEFDAAQASRSVARFTINGQFTAGAEKQLGVIDDVTNEAAAFTALTNRLKSLEDLFDNAATAEPPLLYDNWFVNDTTDSRVIPLPEPLRDRHHNKIYVLPESLQVQQTRFPESISYTAAMVEAKRPPYKCHVAGLPLDGATILLRPPSPILRRSRVVGAAGEVIEVKNYNRTRIEVRGRMPNSTASPFWIGLRSGAMIDQMSNSRITIGVWVREEDGNISRRDVFRRFLVADPRASVSTSEQATEISFQGVE